MRNLKRSIQVIVLTLVLGMIALGLAGTLGVAARADEAPGARRPIGSHALLPIVHTLPVEQTIVGRVIGGQAGWRVQAMTATGRVVAETIAQEDGRYDLPALSSGVYRLAVLNMDGERVAVTGGETVRIDAHRLDQFANYNLAVRLIGTNEPTVVQANGYITGVITASNTGLPVQAAVAIYTAAGQYQTTGYNEAVTGVYSVSVPPGSYKLWFYPFDTYVPEY